MKTRFSLLNYYYWRTNANAIDNDGDDDDEFVRSVVHLPNRAAYSIHRIKHELKSTNNSYSSYSRTVYAQNIAHCDVRLICMRRLYMCDSLVIRMNAHCSHI